MPPLLQLPPTLSRLTCLEDLVLSDNNLQAARLTVRGWVVSGVSAGGLSGKINNLQAARPAVGGCMGG